MENYLSMIQIFFINFFKILFFSVALSMFIQKLYNIIAYHTELKSSNHFYYDYFEAKEDLRKSINTISFSLSFMLWVLGLLK